MKLHSLCLAMAIVVMASACKKEDTGDDNNNQVNEYIANDDSFANFTSFSKVAENNGPDPALGMAHYGNDSTVTRYIYFKDNAAAVDGSYPVGTIIVKESKNGDGSIDQVTAMVKRGNNFNTSGNDWEWFMLTPDGKIATDSTGMPMRGASLLNGMCQSCHNNAGTDFVFSK